MCFVRFFGRIRDTIICFQDLLSFTRKAQHLSKRPNYQVPNDFYFVGQQIEFCIIDQLFCVGFSHEGKSNRIERNFKHKILPIDVCHKRKKRATSRIIGGKEARQGKACAY